MNELNSADEIVVHCQSGMRSARAVELLIKAGFRENPQSEGWNPGVVGPSRPFRAEVLRAELHLALLESERKCRTSKGRRDEGPSAMR